MTDCILTETQIDAIDSKERGIPQAHEMARVTASHEALRERVKEMEALIDTPHTGEFWASVNLEAGHQIKRWGVEHDEGKDPTDWFWLVGFLLGKAVSLPEKRKHHIISSAAVLLNWYRRETGECASFRPGIKSPEVHE